MHSWLDQLLRPLLQISSLLHIEADRRPSVTLGSTQVQTPAATTEARANMVGRRGQTHAVALPPLASSVCKRPDTGSRMSREAHVRFCERAVVKFRRATRLVVLGETHLRRIVREYARYYTILRERTGHWTRMRRSLARFSKSDASCRTPWLAGCITNTSGFRFSARTEVLLGESVAMRRPTLLVPLDRTMQLPLTLAGDSCHSRIPCGALPGGAWQEPSKSARETLP